MKVIIFLTSLFILRQASAQNEKVDQAEETVQQIVHVEPEFPGGDQALYEYLRRNITVPDTAQTLEVFGIVYVQFVIDTTGEITDVNVIRGVHWSLDNEAKRVVKSMPKWTPGRDVNNNKVRVKFTIPIQFRY